jgi:hypothetical protein
MSKPEKKKFFHSPIIQDLTYVRLILNLYERKIGVSKKANVLLYGHGEYFDTLENSSYKTVLETQHNVIKEALKTLGLDDPGWSEYATIDSDELVGPMILAEKNSYGKYDLPAQFHGLFDVVLDGSCFKNLDKNLMDARNKDESVIILCVKKTERFLLTCQIFKNNYAHNSIPFGRHTLLHIKKKNKKF